MLIGTIVNALAIIAGSLVGLLLKWLPGRMATAFGGENPVMFTSRTGERLQDSIMKGVALCVMYIGISGCLKGEKTLVVIISMVLGALIGELLDLDQWIHRLGDWLQKSLERFSLGGGETSVSEGFVTSSLLFCVGAMAVVGALQDGLTGDHATLFAKSLLDGISAVVFASSLGFGVLFSAVAVFLYQGAIAAMASLIAPFLSDAVIAEMTCAGSLLIVALSLNMMGITKIKVMNLLPACLLPIVLCRFM